MKRFLLLLLFYNSCVLAQDSKINIAVLDLDATNIKQDDAKFLSDRLRVELFETGAFNVLERDKMNVILHEQGFQMSGCTSLECAVEAGQLLNVKQMVAGSIGRIGNVYSITLRLIDVKTGSIVNTAKHDYQGELSEMLTGVIPEIARELSPQRKSKPKKVVTQNEKPAYNRWGVRVKAGTGRYNFIDEYNKSIKDFNDKKLYDDMTDMPQFGHFGVEVVWDYNSNWRFNLGVDFSFQSSKWMYEPSGSITDIGITYSNIVITRSFNIGYISTGVDYKIDIGSPFQIYFGSDIGISTLKSTAKRQFSVNGIKREPKEVSSDYVTLGIKLKAGLEYTLSQRMTLSIELSPLLQAEYDTKDEFSNSGTFTALRTQLFPDTMNGSGVLLSLSGTYYF